MRKTIDTIYFIRFYAEFAEWLSCVKRLHDFQEHFLQLEGIKNKLREKLLVNSENIELIDFALYTPKGQKLLSCNEFTFFRKENCLIMGMNGSGKSMFFKAIAGIWPYFTGKILLPKNCNIAFLPQKPYLPLGVLGNCIIYSNAEEDYRLFHNEIVKWLEFFNMRYLIDKLDKEADWCKILSLGEQQKLAIIRALSLQPEWLFMDESTSNMDDLSVRKTYEVLSSLGISVVSISHDAKIRQYHSRVLRISENHIYE